MNRGQRHGRARFSGALLGFFACALLFSALGLGTSQAPAQTPDTLTLIDGEQLIGKLVRVHAGAVTFHSDIAGDVTVPLAKVRTLRAGQFAVIGKDEHFTRETAGDKIPVGAIAIENDTVHVSPPQAEEKAFPAKSVDSLIDAASFNRELRGKRDFFTGWNGPVTLGASLVESTNSAQTYTGSVALVRAVPAADWLPPSSKAIVNLSASYGLAKDPQIIVNGNVLQTASVTKTDILHGGAEYDKYGSHALFGFVSASADHNFGSGLQLQQAYGSGLGWSVINNPRNSVDLKAEMQYEQQQFYNSSAGPSGTSTKNLASAAITETWNRNLAHSMKFNEYLSLTPTFNIAQAYSAVINANFLFPAYKKLNFALSSTDNYLGDPPQGYMRNTFQLTAGVSYIVK
jgi:hypothetical protein